MLSSGIVGNMCDYKRATVWASITLQALFNEGSYTLHLWHHRPHGPVITSTSMHSAQDCCQEQQLQERCTVCFCLSGPVIRGHRQARGFAHEPLGLLLSTNYKIKPHPLLDVRQDALTCCHALPKWERPAVDGQRVKQLHVQGQRHPEKQGGVGAGGMGEMRVRYGMYKIWVPHLYHAFVQVIKHGE